MSAELLYSEMIEQYEALETNNQRINYLQKHNNPRFKFFINLILNKKIKFSIEPPPYRPAEEPAGLNFTYLDAEMDKLYRFIKNHKLKPAGLTTQKETELLLVTLESLHKDEAELLCKIMTKTLKVKNLKKPLVLKVFPDLEI